MSLVKKSLAKAASSVPTSTDKASANGQRHQPLKPTRQPPITEQTEYPLFAAAIESDLAQLKTFTDISRQSDLQV